MLNNSSVKKRNWAFVLYPDSAPEDWFHILQLTGLPFVVSPLHDKDKNPDGTLKKPHYHIILIFGSPTTYNNVKSITDNLNQPIPQPVDQVRGYYRYLTHKDNPEKAQYDESDIKFSNGFDIRDFVEISKSEVQSIKRRLQAVIRDFGFIEYADFMDYVADECSQDEYDVASNNTLFFDRYLSSRRHGSVTPKVNPGTGEVIDDD